MDLRPGSPDGPLWDPEAIPAATVIVLRDAPGGIEALMLKRSRNLEFAGGMWVFPGGRIDPEDHLPTADAEEVDEARALAAATTELRAELDIEGRDEPAEAPPSAADRGLEQAARVAAVREAAEEAGLALDPDALRRWSHWTPPPETPKRFTTAFFVAPLGAAAGEVVIDDGEIREHQWQRPADMLELRDAGQVGLTPPTFITLTQLLPHSTVADVMAVADQQEVEHFATRFEVVDADVIAMYHGDAGYENGDASTPGPRHRLWMSTTWRYERDA